jgi:predicted nucleic acid-binding protein
MIAADTSALVPYLRGDTGPAIDRVAAALAAGDLILPPVVITEILSDHSSAKLLDGVVPEIGVLEIREGFWTRAGLARRIVLRHGLKATIADTLIAQSCIDHEVELITRDPDFRHFAKFCGLKIAQTVAR